MTSDLTPLIAVAIVCAIAGFRIGQHKGRPLAGLLLGLAVIGLVILAFVPATAEARARQAAGQPRQATGQPRQATGQPRQATGKHRAGREAPQRLAAEQAQRGAGYPSPAYPPQASGAFAPPTGQ
jgi:hypothetical protein